MTAFTTKPDGYDVVSTGKVRRWKSIALATGDTLKVSGLKFIFGVQTAKPASLTSWTQSYSATDNSVTITFTLGASTTGPVVVYGID